MENLNRSADYYADVVHKQRVFFESGQTRDVAYRKQALIRLKQGLAEYEQELLAALKTDMGKSEAEGYMSEFAPVLLEINHTLHNLRAWSKPKRVKTPLSLMGGTSRIYSEPYGVTLIISPWNYPISMAIWPLIGAIAAGNCAVIKPSELTPAVARVLTRMLRSLFPPEYVVSLEGGVETSTALLRNAFDYIFFTGSMRVGRIVMEAAAAHLTPVTLELGGKSPCIVAEDANLRLAAKRIVWGKLMNSGQTCVAPDYLYVHSSVKDQLIRHIQQYVEEVYGTDMLQNASYPRVLNDKQYQRLHRFLEQGNIICGGRSDESALRIELTLIDGITWEDAVMQEEIFGPILPVLEYEQLDEVIEAVNRQPKPLACYVFTASKEVEQRVIKEIPFGGGCVNDTVIHLSTPYLPFGGVGSSGMGSYHGKASFDQFSHHKSILKQTTRFDLPVRYITSAKAIHWIKKLVKVLK